MITDNKDFKSSYDINKYLEDNISKKHHSKSNRMIRTVLPDGNVVIGKNKYDALKKIPLEHRSKRDTKSIKLFEDFHGITAYLKKIEEQKQKTNNKLQEIEIRKQKAMNNINKNSIKHVFYDFYKKVNGVDFEKTNETLNNLKSLILYFAKDEEFLSYGVKDSNGNFLSQPSFNKGLCIIGGFGNGKTSIMNTFQRMFMGLDNYSFGRFSSHEIVLRYEEATKHNTAEIQENFWKILTRGQLYIDDVKAEPMALAYGKKNLLNTLFQERYNKKLKTHISINYASGYNHDPLQAILELKAKYSNQVYDRAYEMYNFIEFKGKTFRK